MQIKAFFDKATSSLTYVVYDDRSRDAVIIDPVLDFDPVTGGITHSSADEVIGFARSTGLNVRLLLETHAHADHLSSAQLLKTAFPSARLAIGNGISQVQELFKDRYAMPPAFKTDGSQFDALLRDAQRVEAGTLTFDVLATPGHTPCSMSYDFGGNVFVGDTLFMPDYGVGRTDFPGASAGNLYDSITTRLYRLPEATRVFTGHDYQPGGRELRYESTVGQQMRENQQLSGATGRDDFIRFRRERDLTLSTPRLLHASIQVNIDGGRLPPFVKIPLTGGILL